MEWRHDINFPFASMAKAALEDTCLKSLWLLRCKGGSFSQMNAAIRVLVWFRFNSVTKQGFKG